MLHERRRRYGRGLEVDQPEEESQHAQADREDHAQCFGGADAAEGGDVHGVLIRQRSVPVAHSDPPFASFSASLASRSIASGSELRYVPRTCPSPSISMKRSLWMNWSDPSVALTAADFSPAATAASCSGLPVRKCHRAASAPALLAYCLSTSGVSRS